MYKYSALTLAWGQKSIHGSYGNNKGSKIKAGLYGRSEKGEAFQSQTTIFRALKLTPVDARVFPYLFLSPSSLSLFALKG
jgi:hypothetical protein